MQEDKSTDQVFKSFRAGREEGFDAVFKTFYQPLVFYAVKIIGDQAAAEDIVGDSFISIWNKRDIISSYPGLKAYLYKIVKNACIDWLRRQTRREASRAQLQLLSDATEQSTMEQLVMAETFRQLHTAINQLPPQCRKIIHLLFIGEVSIAEIAAAMNITKGTVRSQRSRGLMLLRKLLSSSSFLVISICCSL